ASASVVATSAYSMRISWSPVVGVDGYQIERSTSGGAFAPIASISSFAPQYDDRGLTPGTLYTYRVRGFVGSSTFTGYTSTAMTLTFLTGDLDGNYRVDFF